MTQVVTETLLTTAPDDTHGMPSGYGDWRFVVEILGPEDSGAVVGNAIVGTDPVSSDVWLDITQYVRGVQWVRGSTTVAAAPDVGVAILQLTSDSHEFDPWRQDRSTFQGMGARFRSPTPIRIGWIDPVADEWRPGFCGVPERWTAFEVSDDADAYVQIELQEPLALAATVPVTYGPTAIGADPDGTRLSFNALDTIFTDFVFPYTDRTGGVGTTTIAGITLEDTLIGVTRELTTATSTWVMSGRDGVIAQYRTPWFEVIGVPPWGTPDPNPGPTVTVASTDLTRSSIRIRHDPDGIINSVTYQSPNAILPDDQVRTESDVKSISLYGERHLDVSSDWGAGTTPNIGVYLVPAFAFTDKQIDALEFGPSPAHFDYCTDVDVRSEIEISHAPRTSPVTVTLTGFVRQLTTSVQIAKGRVFVRSTITPDIYTTTTTEV